LARQSEEAEFKYLNRNIDWFREKQEQKEVSLNLAQRKEQKILDTEFRDEMKATEKALAANDFPSEKYLLTPTEEAPAEPVEIADSANPDSIEEEIASGTGPLDVHLQETLRIVADLVNFGDSLWSKTVTAQTSK
jgi:carboxyl-terminal processing protease